MKRTVLLTVTMTAALTLIASPANAAPSPGANSGAGSGAGLDAAKKLVDARIDGRLETLRALSTAIGGATHLTAAHKTALQAVVTHDQTGLAALKTKADAETTGAALKTDATSMIDDYRIYLLAAPQVHLVIAADLETTAATALSQAAVKLSAAIDTAKKAGKDTTKAEADLADLHTQLTAANTAIAGKADALLAVKPSPDATALHNVVSPVREAVHTSRTDLKKAAQDAKSIKSALGL